MLQGQVGQEAKPSVRADAGGRKFLAEAAREEGTAGLGMSMTSACACAPSAVPPVVDGVRLLLPFGRWVGAQGRSVCVLPSWPCGQSSVTSDDQQKGWGSVTLTWGPCEKNASPAGPGTFSPLGGSREAPGGYGL